MQLSDKEEETAESRVYSSIYKAPQNNSYILGYGLGGSMCMPIES